MQVNASWSPSYRTYTEISLFCTLIIFTQTNTLAKHADFLNVKSKNQSRMPI
uniref:Uncharacterized protein n=1 Tax=Anguilla anguilla TaxID=7936 RepID=A0A0E9SQB6_ANGAN